LSCGCVVCRLFREGGIHWGRIITLLCFGYRLAITYLRRGVAGFFTNIIGWVVKFVVSERIAQWIASQGGWVRSTLMFCPVFHLVHSLVFCVSSAASGVIFRSTPRLSRPNKAGLASVLTSFHQSEILPLSKSISSAGCSGSWQVAGDSYRMS